MTFIDVGANDGLYTMFAAKRVGATGCVIALEPSRRELARLQRNLSINHLQNAITIGAAAGDRDGKAELRIAGFGHEGQNTLGGFAYAIDGAGFEVVDVVRLDRIVKERGLVRVDVVKIDAEGSELAVLRGAKEMLSRSRPVIVLEVVEAALRQQGANRHDVLKLLNEMGYRFWRFGPSGAPEPTTAFDLDGVNLVAVHEASNLAGRLMTG